MAHVSIISSQSGEQIFEGAPRYIGAYLKPGYLEFPAIGSPTAISWHVGDYVVYPRTGKTYRLYRTPQIAEQGDTMRYGAAFLYENVQFFDDSKRLELCPFTDLVPGDNTVHFSTQNVVSFFGKPLNVAERVQACLENQYGAGTWEVRIVTTTDPDLLELLDTEVEFSVSGASCQQALDKVYELWNGLGWIHTVENGVNVITIGASNVRTNANTTVPFAYDDGLVRVERSIANADEIGTRLFAYGSMKNMDATYYRGLDIKDAESVDIEHLMIPLANWGLTDNKPDARKAFIEDAAAIAKLGLIPRTAYFDGTGDLPDIHPTIERMTIGEVYDAGGAGYLPNLSKWSRDQRIDEIVSAVNPTDHGTSAEQGQKYTEDISSHLAALTDTFINNDTVSWTIFSVNTNNPGRLTLNFGQEPQSITLTTAWTPQLDLKLAIYAGGKRVEAPLTIRQTSQTAWQIVLPESVTVSGAAAGGVEVRIEGVITNTAGGQTTVEGSFSTDSATAVTGGVEHELPKTFTATIPQIGFDIEKYAALGEGKTISMKTGMCAGRDFEIKSAKYVSSTDSWELTLYRSVDEDLNIMFPNADYQIAAGDQYVLLDIAMPDMYVTVASNRLLEAARKLLADISSERPFYSPQIDAKVVYNESRVLLEGMWMDVTFDAAREYVLIDSITIDENGSNIPTHEVSLRERKGIDWTENVGKSSSSKSSVSVNGGEQEQTGGVSSVGMTVPTGLTVQGSPITAAGIFKVGLAEGYKIPLISELANYFEPDGDYGNGIKLRGSYDSLRVPGIRLGGGDAALDLEVITVNGQRCLHSPLPILSDKDIAGFYDGGSGGSPSDFDEAAMWAALGGTIGVNEVIDISHIPNLPTTKIYDLETWISGKGFLTQVPVASSSQLGGVKIGSGISIASDGTISAASSEELALAVAMNASRLDDLEAAFDAPVFGELYAETLRSRSASATELWIGAVRLWYQDGSVRVSGGVLADGDVSGFYNGGSGGGGGSFDESAMWQALGTDITTQVIDASHLPTSPVTSVVGLTGAISQADLRTALGLGSFAYISSLAFSGLSSHPTTLAGYGITDVAFGVPGADYVPVKLGGTTKNVLTAHQSLAGYLTTTSAAATYETIANVDAVEQRLALALGTNEARIAALEEWAEAPAVGELYVENLRARMAATDEIRIGGVTITANMIDGKPYLMIAGGVTATLDVSGFYDGGSGGSGSSSFDEAAMWTALGGTIGTNEKVSTAHLPMSDLDTWVAGKGYVASSGVTSISMTVPTGFSVSGVPVTSTGTLALAFASGYSLPTNAKQGNWDTAYANSHTHSNKSVLDGISSSKANNWDAAYGWGNHANAGYLLAATAASTYETIANVDTVEKRLAAALGVAIARLDTLDDWTADVVPELQRYTDTVLGDVRQPLEVALACCASRLDALEYAFADGQFADLKVTTLGVDYLATRGNAWIGGSLCAAGDVGGFYGSDRALKDDIRDFSAKSAADILRRIRLVSFTWNARASRLNADNVGEDFGVIAQEVEAACPRMVRHGHYGEDLLGVDYAKRLPSVLLGGWHDHERRIAALERENKQLKEKLRQNGCI